MRARLARSASTLGVVGAVRIDGVILALAERHPLLGTVVEFHAHLGLSALRTVVGLQIDLLQILQAWGQGKCSRTVAPLPLGECRGVVLAGARVQGYHVSLRGTHHADPSGALGGS